jgi:FKBP-type peptidyl-prolyl cis-trans isomerase
LNRSITWFLSEGAYVYFNDQNNTQWLAQFSDRTIAAQATAAVSVLVAVQNSSEVNYYEPRAESGRRVAESDKIKISYYAFQFGTWPVVQSLLSAKANLATTLARDVLPTGWVTGILGMTCPSTRTIFIPALYTSLASGQRDTVVNFPNQNLIIVTTLHNAKFREEARAVSDTSETDSSPMEPAGPPARRDSESQRPSGRRDSETQRVPSLSEPDTPRMGNIEPTRSSTVETRRDSDAQRGVPVEARLDALERSISAKLDAFTGSQKAVGSVAALAALLSAKQAEIESLTRQIEREKSGESASSAADQTKRELEDCRRKNAELEAAAQAGEDRLRVLRDKIGKQKATAVDTTVRIVKTMMGTVFDQMQTDFEDDTRYTGDQVSEQLRVLLGVKAKEVFQKIQREGLL